MGQDALAMTEYRGEPALIVYGNGEQAFARARRTASSAGCRIASCAPIAGALDGVGNPLFTPVIELTEPCDRPDLIALLDRLQARAARGGGGAVIAVPAGLADLVQARAPHRSIECLCNASEGERVAAFAAATRRPSDRLHDVGREGQELLQKLSEDVGRLADMIASLSDDEPELIAPTISAERQVETVDAVYIRRLIRARRLREQYLPGDLFADPAWDMLLDLMAARLEDNRVAVSSLCIAAAVPATTALRWIKALTDRGLLVRSADPQDGRRVYIELSEETARALGTYLRVLRRTSPGVV
jgi:DNA-binding MarR family transcriptional regulator